MPPIGQTGHRVGLRQTLQFRLRSLAFGNILNNAKEDAFVPIWQPARPEGNPLPYVVPPQRVDRVLVRRETATSRDLHVFNSSGCTLGYAIMRSSPVTRIVPDSTVVARLLSLHREKRLPGCRNFPQRGIAFVRCEQKNNTVAVDQVGGHILSAAHRIQQGWQDPGSQLLDFRQQVHVSYQVAYAVGMVFLKDIAFTPLSYTLGAYLHHPWPHAPGNLKR